MDDRAERLQASQALTTPKEPRYFVCVGTGHEHVSQYFNGLRFLGTVQLEGGALVFHYFEDRAAKAKELSQ